MSLKTEMIKAIHDFLVVSSKFTHPGFARVLGTDASSIARGISDGKTQICVDSNVCSDNNFSKKQKELKFRYVIPNDACSKHFNHTLPLSGFLAIFDDVTTWAIAAEDRDGRPGVSTSLYVERGSTGFEDEFIKPGNIIDIIARVTKMGKKFGFAEAEAVDVKTGERICFGRHTKYLPGPTFIQDLILGPLLPLTKRFAELTTDKHIEFKPDIDEILHFAKISDDYKSGIQHLDTCHNNPFNFYHGGCQAMNIEMMASKYASTIINSIEENNLRTRSLNITYMSSGQNEVHFSSDVGHISNHSLSMNTKIKTSTGKLISEGIIQFEKI